MKKLGIILVVALFCCGFIPQHKAARKVVPQKSISELYSEAIKSLSIRQDTLNALGAIEAIFQQDSNYAPALNLLSRITRRPQNAVDYARRAYLSDTTNNFYLEDYGNALVSNGEYSDAIPVFEKITRHSTEANHYRILALLLDEKGRTTDALKVLDTVEMRLGPNPYFGRLRLYYLLKTGQTLAAEVAAKKAIEEAPYIAENHIQLARVYASTKRDSLAIVSYQKAIAVDSLAVEPWVEICDYYDRVGDVGASLSALSHIFKNEKMQPKHKIEMWKQIIQNTDNYGKFFPQYDGLIKQLYIQNPDNREVALLYANHLFVSKQTEQALLFFKRFLKDEKATLSDYARVIDVEGYWLNRPDSVEHYSKMALQRFPNSVELWQLRSSIAYNKKQEEVAISHLNEALKYAQNDTVRSELFGSIGDIEHSRGNVKKSYKSYDKALRLWKDNSTVLNNYAYFLSLEERDLERALEMTTRANTLERNNPTYLDTKAWVLYKLGRYAEAKKVMQQALSLNRGKSAEYPLHYGDILHALGEEFMARTYWRKALEMGADAKEIEKRFLPKTEEPKKK